MRALIVCVCFIAAAAALPTKDFVISTMGDEPRYQYLRDGEGVPHLVDTWLKASDLKQAARFTPDTQNVYHLFTRSNQFVSQPLLLGADSLLTASNFDASKRTVIVIHGWRDSAGGDLVRLMVPALLFADDVNVIAVDWSVGAAEIFYPITFVNTINSAESIARFVNWLHQVTGATADQLHIIGFSLGGQKAGIIGRNVVGDVPYITSLDPATPGFYNNDYTFRSDDGIYTEVLHTAAGTLNYLEPLGDVDFYFNGGQDQPGCPGYTCNHDRAFEYMAESIWTGGFTGVKCDDYEQALVEECAGEETLQAGGIHAKTGSTGIYALKTASASPFSLG